MTRHYSSRELCEAAGITYRQLHYWTTKGYVTPSIHVSEGSGDPHVWASEDLTLVRATARRVREARLYLSD